LIAKIKAYLLKKRTLKSFHQFLIENGLDWNIDQAALFLEMDGNIVNDGETYFIPSDDKTKRVLRVIDKVIGNKPAIPIIRVLEQLDKDLVLDILEIGKIAQDSGKYTLPNKTVIKKI